MDLYTLAAARALYGKNGSKLNLQEKTATPSLSAQVISPDPGYDGLSEVTVAAAPDSIKNYNIEAILNGTFTHFYTEATAIRANFLNNMPSLVSASMPNVVEIGNSAFINCSNLTEVSCPDAEVISESAFQSSGVSWGRFPNKVKTIGRYAFRSCQSLINIVLPSSLETFGTQSFYSCSHLQTVDLSESLTVPGLGANAFAATTCAFLFRDQTQLNAFASATNWSELADRFQIKGA